MRQSTSPHRSISVIGCMPTMPSRHHSVEKAAASLVEQLDYLIIVFNQYNKIPDWCASYPNIIPIIPDYDVGGYGKIWGIKRIHPKPVDFYVFVDDDNLYAEDFIERLRISCIETGQVTGIHGSNFIPYLDKWLTDRDIKSALENQKAPLPIDIVAANGMMLPAHVFDNLASDKRIENLPRCMDLAIARNLKENGVTCSLAACKHRLFTPIEVQQADSVYMDLLSGKETPHKEIAFPIWYQIAQSRNFKPHKVVTRLKQLIKNLILLRSLIKA